jgi:hypothetical protein
MDAIAIFVGGFGAMIAISLAFYLPRIVSALERIASALEAANKKNGVK